MTALRLAALLDPLGEGWPSMDLAGDELVTALRQWPDEVAVTAIRPQLSPVARRLLGTRHAALNADRLLTRFAGYPTQALLGRRHQQVFHVADQVYAHLTHVLPAGRTGVYCHDLDAFACLVDPGSPGKPAWFRAMTRATLSGLEKAAVVFHSTEVIRRQILAAGLVGPERLVHAPMGVAAEFTPAPGPSDLALIADDLPGLTGRYLLHVGSALPRKRLDVLLDVAAAVRAEHPDLQLVQVGATFPAEVEERVDALQQRAALHRPSGRIERSVLAALYRGAAAVLVTSDAEGFGLPVIEALACGAPVVASDIEVLREVGGPAVRYCPVADVAAWASTVGAVLAGAAPPLQVRAEQAAGYTWDRHARIILTAYQEL